MLVGKSAFEDVYGKGAMKLNTLLLLLYNWFPGHDIVTTTYHENECVVKSMGRDTERWAGIRDLMQYEQIYNAIK